MQHVPAGLYGSVVKNDEEVLAGAGVGCGTNDVVKGAGLSTDGAGAAFEVKDASPERTAAVDKAITFVNLIMFLF